MDFTEGLIEGDGLMQKDVNNAIITDGFWRKSLSAIRSLGKAGFDVSVMGDSIFTTGFWSRFTSQRISSPTAADDEEVFGKKLMLELEKYNKGIYPILFPMEDASLMWIAKNIEKVSPLARILIPPIESLNIAQDKGATICIAKELALPCPKTWEPDNINDFIEIVSDLEPEGFIVKPRSGTGSSGVIYGKQLTLKEWSQHWNCYGNLVIQERIPSEGHGLGVSLLMDNGGECIASFTHERLQQYPVSGGPSTDRQSIHNPQLVELSIKLLKRLSWRGIAMVEWKDDIRDGIPKLIEINPRFWGSLELAVRAGVNFPVLYAKAAMGEKVECATNYPEEVRCRWIIPGDILRYLSQPKEERESFKEFLKDLPHDAEEWDKSDIKGTIASIVCPAIQVLNPHYWKYLRR